MPRQSSGPRLIKRKDKPNWFIRYIDEREGKQKDFSTGTSDREQAEEKLEEFLRLRRTKRISSAVPHTQFTVAQALDDYAHHKMGEPAAVRLGYSMVYLLDFWNDDTIDHVNIETVKAYIQFRLEAGCVQATVRRELTDLRSAINHSINMNRLFPLKFPKLPKGSAPKDRWLSENEFARLLWFAGKDKKSKFSLRYFMIIAFYSGQRKTAIMELEWNQFDFENNTLNFVKTDMFSNSSEVIKNKIVNQIPRNANASKIVNSKKPRAFQPMPPELMRLLKKRYERYGKLTKYVFHKKSNPKIRQKSIDKSFRVAAQLSGLKDVTPHTLRHTRVSLMLQSGEKVIDIAAYINMSLETIARVMAIMIIKIFVTCLSDLGVRRKSAQRNKHNAKLGKNRAMKDKFRKGEFNEINI